MKTKLLTGAIIAMTFLTSHVMANSIHYSSTQVNTAPWGCKTSDEHHEGNTYFLTCTDPGEKICQFSDGTCPNIMTWQAADQFVRDQISNGVFSGRMELTGGDIVWQGTDIANFNYTITETN